MWRREGHCSRRAMRWTFFLWVSQARAMSRALSQAGEFEQEETEDLPVGQDSEERKGSDRSDCSDLSDWINSEIGADSILVTGDR